MTEATSYSTSGRLCYNTRVPRVDVEMSKSVDGYSAFLIIAGVLSFLYPALMRKLPKVGNMLTVAVGALHSMALGLLLYLRLADNFSFENVYQNSHTLQPILYKIVGLWGNYEGSLLLYIWLLSMAALLLQLLLPATPLRTNALVVQHLLLGVFVVFQVIFANPFLRTFTVDNDGLGFNPLLQDVGLSIHPPILFSGYVGFSPVLAITLAALRTTVAPAAWAHMIRGWVLGAWTLLTFGIALGGWWAYRVLGWGGFWSWDPVENVVLLPWLLGMALVHMLPVVRKSNIYCNFTFFLAIAAFISSLYSMFFVRSGFLISVHTFAHDASRGGFLLALVSAVMVAGCTAFVMCCKTRSESCAFNCLSRITLFTVHAVLSLTAFFIILLGTVYPVVLEALTGVTVAVGAPYYNSLFSIILVVLLGVMIILPCISYEGKQPLTLTFKVTTLGALVSMPVAMYQGMSGLLLWLAGYLFFSIIEDFLGKLPNTWTKATLKATFRPGRCAMLSAHLGVAVAVVGIVYSSTYQLDTNAYLRRGDDVKIAGYKATLDEISLVKEEYYESLTGEFAITKDAKTTPVCTLKPENRFYYVEGTHNIISSSCHNILSDLYVVIGTPDLTRGLPVQLRYKPLINLVWGGFMLLVIGGVFGTINAVLKMRALNSKTT